MFGLQGEERLAIETVFALALAREMNFGVLLRPALFDGALDRQRQSSHQTLHISLNFVEMFVTKMFDGVVHRVRLEHTDTLRHGQAVIADIVWSYRHSVWIT